MAEECQPLPSLANTTVQSSLISGEVVSSSAIIIFRLEIRRQHYGSKRLNKQLRSALVVAGRGYGRQYIETNNLDGETRRQIDRSTLPSKPSRTPMISRRCAMSLGPRAHLPQSLGQNAPHLHNVNCFKKTKFILQPASISFPSSLFVRQSGGD